MPSLALKFWVLTRSAHLDEIESAHRSVGGRGPGRRRATLQINYAYAMLVSSQFQGFCRDLHSECVDHMIRVVKPVILQAPLNNEFALNRKLDKGNPNPGNIGADFNRLGFLFWPLVLADDARNSSRQNSLVELNEWRNAIAHQDFDRTKLGGATVLRLRRVREWRSACVGLAESFDRVTSAYLDSVIGSLPW